MARNVTVMAEWYRQDDGTINTEALYRRFKRDCERAGIARDLRQIEHHETKGSRRRRKRRLAERAAKRRARK